MARRVLHHGDRRSGWPPERSGRAGLGPLAADDVALAVLWALVLGGILFVAFVALSTLFGWDGRLVSTAYAAPESPVSAGSNLLGALLYI